MVVIVGVLIALNAASYLRLERRNDTESLPNRSTFNAGATGTRAFYELLQDSGKSVIRWQETPSALFTRSGKNIKTFVVIGELRQSFNAEESRDLLNWVRQGGRLVIIDRELDEKLIPDESPWKIQSSGLAASVFNNANPANVKEMTNGVIASRPAQPTLFTQNVEAVMPSRFAGSISLEFKGWDSPKDKENKTTEKGFPKTELFFQSQPPPPMPKPTPKPQTSTKEGNSDKTENGSGNGIGSGNAPKPTPKPKRPGSIFDDIFGAPAPAGTPISEKKYTFSAPVSHLAGSHNILVDLPHGAGQIVYLSDPYIIANSGIQLVDNSQLALNLMDNGGTIAFDEFHQGYGASGTRLAQYFANTPFPAIAAQLAFLTLLFVISQGRRFARALPLPNPDRRSKLEYVAAMAELQKRTHSFDLAMETIYSRTRRNLSRAVGVDNTTTTRLVLAQLVAERARMNKDEVRKIFHDCEDIIHGEKTNARTVLELIEKLRELESRLGLRRETSHTKK